MILHIIDFINGVIMFNALKIAFPNIYNKGLKYHNYKYWRKIIIVAYFVKELHNQCCWKYFYIKLNLTSKLFKVWICIIYAIMRTQLKGMRVISVISESNISNEFWKVSYKYLFFRAEVDLFKLVVI